MMHKLLIGVLAMVPLFLSAASAQLTTSGFDLGSVEIQVLGSSSEIRMGQTGEVGKFRISNRTGRNLDFDTLRLRNYGTADLTKSFESIYLTTTTGEVLAELVDSSRKYWTWKFTDQVSLSRGDSLIVSVKARLIYAKRGQTVEFGFRRDEDLALSDAGSGFGVRCENCEGTRLKEYRLDTGGVYITRQPTYRASRYYGSRNRVYSGSAYESQFRNVQVMRTNTYRPTSSRYVATPRGSQQYSPGSRDVVFFSSRLNSNTGVAVEGIFLQLGSGSFVADKDDDGQNTTLDDINEAFGDWKLLVNGVYEDSTNDLELYRGRAGVLFNTNIDLPSNSQIVLIGRIQNSGQTGDKIRFGLNRSGLIDPVYLRSGGTVNNINGGSTSIESSVR